eukprot:TRINITY_DN10013_c0_g1_i1.p1 TRINITY_DN10013_c0_g1~~TRINITY_DN10013_c0_g1_i1.p1  ORF type:complete len:303 (-),score=45.05 TRINITY_DN10013_c0_g1_i1:109-1017(-)
MHRLHAITGHLVPTNEGQLINLVPTLNSTTDGQKLVGKVAVITGAGSNIGIGKATAQLFSRHGANVLCVDVDEDGLQQTKESIEKESSPSSGRIHIFKADVSSEKENEAIINECLRLFGRIDIYFANAGITGAHLHFDDVSGEDFEHVLRVNTLSVFYAIKLASKAMRSGGHGGSIICTSSVAGIRSGAGGTPYSASKAAVLNLVQTMSNQLRGSNIRLNAICPGLIHTNMTDAVFTYAKHRGVENKIGQLNPLLRAGSPSEIASVVLFLSTNESSYVNGQAIAIDGGLSTSHPVSSPGKMA